MANKNDLLNKRLQEIQKNNEKAQKKKPDVVQNIVTGKEDKPDFSKMAEELKKKKKPASLLDGAVKDTIYIREDLYNAMQALCQKQGDKRKFVNQAYEEFLTRKYKEIEEELDIDK